MNKVVLAAVIAAAFASPAFAAAPSTNDFVKTAAMTDMFEIEASKLARGATKQQTLQDFAAHMIEDHTKTSDQLKGLVDSGEVKASLPTALDADHQKKIDRLKSRQDGALVQAYATLQVKGHMDAIKLFSDYAQNGENAALKRWAADTLPTLKQHLKMARQLKTGKARKS